MRWGLRGVSRPAGFHPRASQATPAICEACSCQYRNKTFGIARTNTDVTNGSVIIETHSVQRDLRATWTCHLSSFDFEWLVIVVMDSREAKRRKVWGSGRTAKAKKGAGTMVPHVLHGQRPSTKVAAELETVYYHTSLSHLNASDCPAPLSLCHSEHTEGCWSPPRIHHPQPINQSTAHHAFVRQGHPTWLLQAARKVPPPNPLLETAALHPVNPHLSPQQTPPRPHPWQPRPHPPPSSLPQRQAATSKQSAACPKKLPTSTPRPRRW